MQEITSTKPIRNVIDWLNLTCQPITSIVRSYLHFVQLFLKTFLEFFKTLWVECPRDLGSIPGRVKPKTLKMVLDTSLLNTQ